MVVAMGIRKIPDAGRVCTNENCRARRTWNREVKRGPRVLKPVLARHNVWNIKVRLTGCLSSNYSPAQLVPAPPLPRHRQVSSSFESTRNVVPRFTTKRDTCRMCRRLRRSVHTRATDCTAFGEQRRVFFHAPSGSIKSTWSSRPWEFAKLGPPFYFRSGHSKEGSG